MAPATAGSGQPPTPPATAARCAAPGGHNGWCDQPRPCPKHEAPESQRCPDCGALDPMGDEDAWHNDDCPLVRPASIPTHAVLKGRGKVRVLSYDGNGMFTVLTNRDVKVFTHRDKLTFTNR